MGLRDKGKGLKQKPPENKRQNWWTDNSMVVTRGKGVEVEEGKGR